jgi:large subunit ribosomal protein L33
MEIVTSSRGTTVPDRRGIEPVVAERAGRTAIQMARNEIRPIVKLRSTAGTGYTYVTRKNRRSDPDRMVLRKFDPVARRHVEFREER